MVIQINLFKQIADFISQLIFDNSCCFYTTGFLLWFDCKSNWPQRF